MAFQEATKYQSKLRLAIYGPSGSGKTYSALRIATGLVENGKIAVIDTERGRARKYADRFKFDVSELTDMSILTLVQEIEEAHSYDVLIVDSASHSWRNLLTDIDQLTRKYKGNKWAAWSEGTPKQHQLIDTILAFPGHIIVTMRSKTEWAVEKDPSTGKNRPVRIGLEPEQGKGIEYEFDIVMEVSMEHIGTIITDHTDKFQDAIIEKPGEGFGRALSDWLQEGEKTPHS